MKALLQLMLVHYFKDGKRSTSAAITRKLDREIRALVEADPTLTDIYTNCKKVAEAQKRQARDAANKHQNTRFRRPNPGAVHIPCGPKGR